MFSVVIKLIAGMSFLFGVGRGEKGRAKLSKLSAVYWGYAEYSETAPETGTMRFSWWNAVQSLNENM